MVLYLPPLLLLGQQNRISDYNTIQWNAFVGTWDLHDKWGIHGEFQWRRSDFISDPQQNLYRIGLNYKPNTQVVFRLGGAYIDTYPYGKVPLQAAAKLFPEYRIFQMVQLNNPIGSLNIAHRFMLEQRWIGNFLDPNKSNVSDFIFLNRFRYMLRLEKHSEKFSFGQNTPYFATYNELMLGFGYNIGQNIFDQNRFGVLTGLKINKALKIEAGYLSQILMFGRLVDEKQVLQYNSGLIISSYLRL